jgi:hypothetical protein
VRITLLPHAIEQMRKRGISEEQVRLTVQRPERTREGRLGRVVAERLFSDAKGGYLVRVPYNVGQDEAVVVTVIKRRVGSRRTGGGAE